MSDKGPESLQGDVSDFRSTELPVYHPVGDVSLYADLKAPAAISNEVLRLVEEIPEIDLKQPTNSQRLRLEAIFAKKKANRYLKHVEWKAGKAKAKPKEDGRATRWRKLRTEKRRQAEHKRRRREENVEKYWNLKLFQGEWAAAELRAGLNGVQWCISEEEWEDSGIEEAIGDVLNPKLKRYDHSEPWTLDNLMILDGTKVVWDGVEEKMRRMGYIL